MAGESLVTLRVSRRFTAAPARVFDAWLDPDTARNWLFATPTGQMIRVEIDARIGGMFVFVRRDGDDVEHVGEYIEIDRPRRLVFTFGVPQYSPVVTKVIIDIVATDTGCELVLTHEGVLPEWASPTESGWKMILDSLARTLDPESMV